MHFNGSTHGMRVLVKLQVSNTVCYLKVTDFGKLDEDLAVVIFGCCMI